MKRRSFDKQIISIFREDCAGISAREFRRKHTISGATLYSWRKKYGGMMVTEVKRLKNRGQFGYRKLLYVKVVF